MKVAQNLSMNYTKVFSAFLTSVVIGLSFTSGVSADPISPATAEKVEQYKKKLTEWATDPAIIAVVKKSNAMGGLVGGMTNAKWEELNDNDPVVLGFQTSDAGKYLKVLEEDKGINKLYARDDKGNLVAGSSKPVLYNNASRAPFKNAIGGKVFSTPDAKADPTTQKLSVQVSVPILSDGKPIGVLHTAVNAE